MSSKIKVDTNSQGNPKQNSGNQKIILLFLI